MEVVPSALTPQPSASAAPLPETRLLRIPIYLRQTAKELASAIQTAADVGFHGVVVPLTLGGLPIFATDVPQQNQLREVIPQFRKRDVLGEVLNEALERNLRVYATLNPWRPMGDPSADKTMRWFRNRLSWFATGPRWKGSGRVSPAARGFCPVNLDVRRYWGDLVAQAVEAYPLSGLTFEMLEPPFTMAKGLERCFCPICRAFARERFELDLVHFLDNVHQDEARQAWRQLQIERVQNWVGYFSSRCHKSRRGLLIRLRTKAAIERPEVEDKPMPEELDAPPEQIARPLLVHGVLDGLEFNGLKVEDAALGETLELNLAIWPDDSLLYPSLQCAKVDALAEKLETLRRMPVMGVEVEWNGAMTAAVAAQVQTACFSSPALQLELAPMDSVAALFEEVSRIAPLNSGVAEFLSDLLQFARSPSGMTAFAALDALVQNLRGLEARIIQGQVDFGDQAGLALCRISQAKRLARLASHSMGI